jgi:hypothetical protein
MRLIARDLLFLANAPVAKLQVANPIISIVQPEPKAYLRNWVAN